MPGFKIVFPDTCGSGGTPTGPTHTLETARQHRYLLDILEPFGTQDNGLLLLLAKCTRPTIEFDKIMIHSSQDEIPRPGKQHWQPVEFTFYEKLDGGDGQQVDQCAKLIYGWWAQTMLNIQASLFNPVGEYLKDAQLSMLDGDGISVWTYFIYDSWPSKVTPSDLDYSASAIAMIGVTLQYSKAEEKRP